MTTSTTPQLRALVVEDDRHMRALIEIVLRERGHVVRGTERAERALELHRAEPADLLFVDWSLPGMDGLELCRRVRELPGGDEVAIIVITGRDGAEDQIAALDAGADDYVTKPFEPQLLFTRVLVAERHLAETRRRQRAEQRLRQIGENAPGMLYQLALGPDRARQFTFVSDGSRALLGIEPAAIERDMQVLLSRIHPDDVAAFEWTIDSAAATLSPFRFECRIVMPTGAVRWCRATSTGERTTDGGSIWSGIVVDITEPKLVEESLRRSEATFRRLIEAAPEAISVVRNDRLLYVNPTFVTMLRHRSAADLVGQPLRAVVHPDDLAHVRVRLAGRTPGGSQPPPAEYRLVRKDGTSLPIEASSIPIQYEGTAAVLTVGRDVSELRQMRSRLMQADRMATVGILSAGVAHELNNPLGYVLTNLRVLHETLLPLRPSMPAGTWDEISSMLRETRDGAERMRLIVQDLRTFSRPDDEQRTALDVRRVLDSCIKIAGNEIRHCARLRKEYGPTPLVEANENRLGQILLNLLINAVQSFPQGRATEANEIAVSTGTDEQGRAFAEVRDNGRGIPAADLERIFEPFYTTKVSGTGLGLPIAQNIVTALGGEIMARSRENEGTTFRVVLPPTSALPRRHQTAPPPSMRDDTRARVLVVDDEPLVASALRRALREHDVLIAGSGQEAVDRLRNGEDYDVVLCDLMMPDMAGADVFAAVSAARPGIAGRFVFMTGGAFTPETRSFLERIDNVRVEKPFDIHALRALVRDRARAARDEREPDAR